MKVPPKRKGNLLAIGVPALPFMFLNESPSEKEGKFDKAALGCGAAVVSSMKVPPKRKGNS